MTWDAQRSGSRPGGGSSGSFPPVEPPPSRWALDVRGLPAGEDLVAVGADLEPGTLLAAYRAGLFPMPVGRLRRSALGWWSPDPRGVLPLAGLVVARSLRKSLRRYEIRVDTAFDDVVAACADPCRPGGWITERVRTAYGQLHRLGWAHSVECWREGRLVGGLYGVSIGGLFAGESMFHAERDASKAALVALVGLLRAAGDAETRVLDVQWCTEHLASLGAIEIPRAAYLRRLAAALPLPQPRWELDALEGALQRPLKGTPADALEGTPADALEGTPADALEGTPTDAPEGAPRTHWRPGRPGVPEGHPAGTGR